MFREQLPALLSMALLVFGAVATRAAGAGDNMAPGKPYALEPGPTYGDCSDDPERALLTDGQYTEGYFWVQKTTVGWVHSRPVAITIDLGQVEPIAGVSYSTAAGVADVAWPASIWIMVSDDGRQWTFAGDLIELSNRHGAPPPKPYRLHRFVTRELETRGRYVALVVDQMPYAVVDEVEVYRGEEAWLGVAPRGRQTTETPLQNWRSRQLIEQVRGRLLADLAAICDGAAQVRLGATEGEGLRARAEKLRAEANALEEVPERFTTILPLNALHRRVYALHAPVLRARGYRGLTVWGGYRYDPLQPLEAPARPPVELPALGVQMMGNEHRAQVLNLTNATDGPLRATIRAMRAEGVAEHLALRAVLFTDTQPRVPVAAALSSPTPASEGLGVIVEAGVTRQVWLEVDSRGLAAGDYELALSVSTGRAGEVAVPLRLHVADLTMPDGFSIAIGGWDETNGTGGYDVTMDNMAALIANLRGHGVNMPWNNPRAIPAGGAYDAEGNLIAPLDFGAWDEWVGRWPGARHWGCFAAVGDSFHGEPLGTARFDRMVGAWARAWADHARVQGIQPHQIKLLLVDEPRSAEQDRVIIVWARAIRAVEPELVIWNDPIHQDPAAVDPSFYELSGVLSPNTPRFLGSGKGYQDFFVAQQQAGRELWFYSCSGPAKLLDPASYWRGQFWLSIRYGGKGSCYWAFGDEAGNSWNAYVQPRASFSPLFLSRTEVTDAKQMEAIREGAQDYEYFAMLRARVEGLEGRGTGGELVEEARALLVEGPQAAVGIMGPDKQEWVVPKDRETLDRVRLQTLEMLERLGE